MQSKKFFSFFVVIGLLVLLPVITVTLANQGFEIRISALEDDTPNNIVTTNVSNDSFSVSWITERPVIGGIKLADGTVFYEDDAASYHSLTVTGVNPDSIMQFTVLSGDKEFNRDNGSPYSVQTAQMSPTDDTFLVYGQVFSPDGFSFQQEGIVVLQLESATGKSQEISTLVNETGGYQVDLGGLLSSDLTRNFPYRGLATLTVTVYVSHEDPGVEKSFPINFSQVRQIPNVYLGDVNVDVIPAIEGIVE